MTSVVSGNGQVSRCLVAWVWRNNLLRLIIVKRNGMLYGDVGTDVTVVRWSQFVKNYLSSPSSTGKLRVKLKSRSLTCFNGKAEPIGSRTTKTRSNSIHLLPYTAIAGRLVTIGKGRELTELSF